MSSIPYPPFSGALLHNFTWNTAQLLCLHAYMHERKAVCVLGWDYAPQVREASSWWDGPREDRTRDGKVRVLSSFGIIWRRVVRMRPLSSWIEWNVLGNRQSGWSVVGWGNFEGVEAETELRWRREVKGLFFIECEGETVSCSVTVRESSVTVVSRAFQPLVIHGKNTSTLEGGECWAGTLPEWGWRGGVVGLGPFLHSLYLFFLASNYLANDSYFLLCLLKGFGNFRGLLSFYLYTIIYM